MKLPTPGETAVSTETETETEPEQETTIWDELNDDHKELFQTYWGVVETYRGVRKLPLTYLFDSPEGVSNADIAAYKSESPLAQHFVFYKELKDDLKEQFRTLRETGEIPRGCGLKGFKEEFEPDFEYEVLSADNAAEEWGLNPEAFYQDEDEIWFPEEYEAPTDDDGNLKIWNAAEGDEVSDNKVLETLKGVDRIGEKKAEAALEALKEAGYSVVHN